MTYTKKFNICTYKTYTEVNYRTFTTIVFLESLDFFSSLKDFYKEKRNTEIVNVFDSEEEALKTYDMWVKEYLEFANDYNSKQKSIFSSRYDTDFPTEIFIIPVYIYE